MDITSNSGAAELFRQADGLGANNNFFLGYKDSRKEGAKIGAAAGLAAGLGATVWYVTKKIKSDNRVLNGNFAAAMFNQTENGIGIIPFVSSKLVINYPKIENLEPVLEDYIFFEYGIIKEIIVKNLAPINKKVQVVIIKLNDKFKLDFTVRVKEKDLPYQEENFAKFMAQYKKK